MASPVHVWAAPGVALRCALHARPLAAVAWLSPVDLLGVPYVAPALRAACSAFGRGCLPFASSLVGGASRCPAPCAACSAFGHAYLAFASELVGSAACRPFAVRCMSGLWPRVPGFRQCTCRQRPALPCAARCMPGLWPRLPGFRLFACWWRLASPLRCEPHVQHPAVFSLAFASAPVGGASRRRALHAACSAFGRACMASPVELLATLGVALRCALHARPWPCLPGLRQWAYWQRLALHCTVRCMLGFWPRVPGLLAAPCIARRCAFSLRPCVFLAFASALVGSASRCPMLRAALRWTRPCAARCLHGFWPCLYRLSPADLLAAP